MQPPTAVPFYDVTKGRLHMTSLQGECVASSPLSQDVLEVVSSLVPSIDDMYFTVAYDMAYPGIICQFTRPIHTIADLINNWNIKASNKHELIMNYEVDDPQHVCIQNMSQFTIHLFANSHGYLGSWTPCESKRLQVMTFTTFANYDANVYQTGPIVVMMPRPVFTLTAYIYSKKHESDFYILHEDVTIPPGFYRNTTELIAIMNKNIAMRGARNGFIYNFVQGKHGKIGIEASHRQPEPSFLLIKPLSFVLGMWEGEPHTLQLRTNKRYIFENTVAHVIM